MLTHEDVVRLREVLAEMNATTDGSYIERIANGQRIWSDCVAYMKEHGPALLALAEAVPEMRRALQAFIDANEHYTEDTRESRMVAGMLLACGLEMARTCLDKTACLVPLPDCGEVGK